MSIPLIILAAALPEGITDEDAARLIREAKTSDK